MFNVLKKYPDNHTLGPLLITIGPNCCGKTEFVNSLGEDVREFSHENIHGLYERIPIGLAAAVWRDKITGDVIQALKNMKSNGKPLMERLKEQKESEVVYLTLYFARMMTLEELTAKLRKILPTAEYFNGFIEVISGIKAMMKSKTIDVYNPEVVESGVIGLVSAVKAAIKTEPGVICWGNHNVEPVYYKEILNTCYKYKRVVRFVRWGQELPACSLKELFKRSILQFLKTGRYVETFEIAKNWAKSELFFKHRGGASHYDIAKASGYYLDINGTLGLSVHEHKRQSTVVKFDTTKWSEWSNTGRIYNLRGKATGKNGVMSSTASTSSRNASPSIDGDSSVVSERSDLTGNSKSKRPSITPVSEADEEEVEESKSNDFDVSTLSLNIPAGYDSHETVRRLSATAVIAAANVSRTVGAANAPTTAPPTASSGRKASPPSIAATTPPSLTKENSQASVAMWDAFYENLDASKLLANITFTDQQEHKVTEQQQHPEVSESTQPPVFYYFGFKESLATDTAAPVEVKITALPSSPPSSDPAEELYGHTMVQPSEGAWCVIPTFSSLFSF